MADNYSKLSQSILDNLRDRKVLEASIEYLKGKGLIKRTSTAGNYSVIFHGSAKEVHCFLQGINYIHCMEFPTNKQINK